MTSENYSFHLLSPPTAANVLVFDSFFAPASELDPKNHASPPSENNSSMSTPPAPKDYSLSRPVSDLPALTPDLHVSLLPPPSGDNGFYMLQDDAMFSGLVNSNTVAPSDLRAGLPLNYVDNLSVSLEAKSFTFPSKTPSPNHPARPSLLRVAVHHKDALLLLMMGRTLLMLPGARNQPVLSLDIPATTRDFKINDNLKTPVFSTLVLDFLTDLDVRRPKHKPAASRLGVTKQSHRKLASASSTSLRDLDRRMLLAANTPVDQMRRPLPLHHVRAAHSSFLPVTQSFGPALARDLRPDLFLLLLGAGADEHSDTESFDNYFFANESAVSLAAAIEEPPASSDGEWTGNNPFEQTINPQKLSLPIASFSDVKKEEISTPDLSELFGNDFESASESGLDTPNYKALFLDVVQKPNHKSSKTSLKDKLKRQEKPLHKSLVLSLAAKLKLPIMKKRSEVYENEPALSMDNLSMVLANNLLLYLTRTGATSIYSTELANKQLGAVKSEGMHKKSKSLTLPVGSITEMDIMSGPKSAHPEESMLIVKQPLRRGRKPSLQYDPSKIFSCSLCPRKFKRQEHLKRHFRSLHTGEKPFGCNICGKKFSRSDNLGQHIKTHS